MKKFAGINTIEVWDFRLSLGSPILYADGEFWAVKIWANDGSGILDEHTTDVKTTGNPHDTEGVAACYGWLYSVRDKFSRDHIELRKPVTKAINAANAKAVGLNGEAAAALAEKKTDLYHQKIGEMHAHLSASNAAIKRMTAAFHAEITEGGAP